jgi:hypothetical protein
MNFLLKAISDPKIFNCIILFLYSCAAVRWFVAGKFGDGMYWVSAFMITFTVTFLMGSK